MSTKNTSPIFDILEQLPTPVLTRNDLCPCNSGKKYKKCCLEKNKPDSFSRTGKKSFNIRRESLDIKIDCLTPEEAQNDFAPIPEEDQEIMAKLHDIITESPEMIDSEDCAYFQELYMLKAKYPDYPVILNYLVNGYKHIGEDDRAEEVTIETYEKFPNYLFAMTERANLYLNRGLPEKAFEVLKGAYTLKQLYPNRTTFHVTELKAFEHSIATYLCTINEFKQAQVHIDILQQVLDEDDPFLKSVKSTFKRTKLIHKFTTTVMKPVRSLLKRCAR